MSPRLLLLCCHFLAWAMERHLSYRPALQGHSDRQGAIHAVHMVLDTPPSLPSSGGKMASNHGVWRMDQCSIKSLIKRLNASTSAKERGGVSMFAFRYGRRLRQVWRVVQQSQPRCRKPQWRCETPHALQSRQNYCFDLSFTIIDLSSITHPPEMPAVDDSKRKAARETIDILHEISTLLVCRSDSNRHDGG